MVFVVRRSFSAIDSAAIAARRAEFIARGSKKIPLVESDLPPITDPFLRLREQQQNEANLPAFRK